MIEPRKGEKTCWMPKLRVEPERRKAYEKAYERDRRGNPKLKLADWARLALDRASGFEPTD